MTEVEYLNKWLKDQGTSLEGKTIYRLIWSDSAFENRYGFFRDFTPGGLFIREVVETRKTRKYNYIHERWILEKWAPGNLTASKELPDAINGDYIPVYVFEDKKGNYLPPTQKALEFILNFMKGQVKQDEKIDPRILEEKEINYQIDTLLDSPDIRTFGPTRDSVAYTRGLKSVPEFNRS